VSKAMFQSKDAIAQARVMAVGPTTSGEPPPTSMIDWLARLRLLSGVPFGYLVVDDGLLPEESIRFFYLDRNWTDAAVDGALSVGAGTSRERAHLRARHDSIRDAIDAAERNVWATDVHPNEVYAEGQGEVVTGFLMRSRAVSGWPGLHVYAERDGDKVRLLRVDRLAPAVLFVLFDGVPDEVTIEEPRQGLQFGFDATQTGGRRVPVRDANWEPTGVQRDVRFRPGAPGILDMTDLQSQLGATTVAQFALQLVQLPFSQEFSGSPSGFTPFAPSISLADLDSAFGNGS
jgi:hypothetical protein